VPSIVFNLTYFGVTILAKQGLRTQTQVKTALEVIMIDKMFVEHFSTDWIASWNAHDLDRILSHYTDGFEMSSPVIIKVAGELSGTLCDRKRWNCVLAFRSNLKKLIHIEMSVSGVRLDRMSPKVYGVIVEVRQGFADDIQSAQAKYRHCVTLLPNA
jgi:hypothetical protein